MTIFESAQFIIHLVSAMTQVASEEQRDSLDAIMVSAIQLRIDARLIKPPEDTADRLRGLQKDVADLIDLDTLLYIGLGIT